jgi:hypothetical protein
VNVAVICVLLATFTLLTVRPLPLTATVAPEAKFVPVSVTGTLAPCAPLFGLTEVSVGPRGLTVNGTVLLVAAEVLTERL